MSYTILTGATRSFRRDVSYTILTGVTRSFRRDVSQTTSISLDVSPHDVDMSSRPKDVKYQKDVVGSSEPTRLDVPGERVVAVRVARSIQTRDAPRKLVHARMLARTHAHTHALRAPANPIAVCMLSLVMSLHATT